MKKFLISILIGIGLILPGLVLGAIGYVRTPSGFTIQNPVSFEVSGVFDNEPTAQSWQIQLAYKNFENNTVYFTSHCIITNNETWTDSFPLTGENSVAYYIQVLVKTWWNADCTNLKDQTTLEYNAGNELFKIVEAPSPKYTCSENYECVEDPGGEFETLEECENVCIAPPPEANWFFGSGLVAGLKDVVGEIFGDMWILLTIFIGLPLAFWLTHKVVGLIRVKQ